MTNDEGDIDDIMSTEAEFDEDHQFLHLDYREIDNMIIVGCCHTFFLFTCRLAREPHRNLVVNERRIREHATSQRYKKSKEYRMVEELAREPHRNLVVSERRIREHATSQRYKKSKEYRMVEE
nr:DNA mismatch repair protein MutS, core [Tanacetum cinerariifolium]